MKGNNIMTEKFRIIVYAEANYIFNIVEQNFRWRKDGLSTTLCNAIAHAIKIKPAGGRIEIHTSINKDGENVFT